MEPAQKHSTITIVSVVSALLALILAAGVGTWWLYFRDEGVSYNGVAFPGAVAPAVNLTDQHGKPFTLEDHRGKVVILYFGYTSCPDFCPNTLVDLIDVRDKLGDDASKVDVVMVTVDPGRDTPERLGNYLDFFDPTFYGLSGTEQDIRTTARNYGAVFKNGEATPAADGTPTYLVDHTTVLYGIDPKGNLVVSWPYGMDTQGLADDVHTMLND